MVTCRVCQAMIDISGKRDQHVVKCCQCNEATFNTLNNALARCPHCRKVSSVGPDYARGRANIFLIFALLFLFIGIGVTVGTYVYARAHSGIYVAYVGAFALAIVLMARSMYYCFMKVSIIEGPM
ncbi:hypothetical protein MML48_1g10567 [Holotrichia oblita]|uniref:Uncharacterized protein n=1 Tax=Holotrichia oblita TaxID=644536 RepID=A0ACB9TWY4_HOLOL|nr:hypothetical protein MML48_1g10567 [Holotrichia oblita]